MPSSRGHIDTVTPVGSQHIAKKWGKALSPATVRSEMAALEQDGYITRPHASAGGLPTDLGYRMYVRQFLANPVLGPREKGHIKRRLVHVAMDQEGWAKVCSRGSFQAHRQPRNNHCSQTLSGPAEAHRTRPLSKI